MTKPQDYTSPSKEVEATPEQKAGKDADLVVTWVKELGLALTREKSFRITGRKVVALYESEKADATQFNILFSNTETLAPALYNTTPRPVVQRRFKDTDELGKYASEATQRVLEFLLDPGEASYSPFDELMQSAVLEALLPGRGVTWFKYEPTWKDEEQTEVTGETVCGEEVPWERFRHGYAKKWPQVPWVSREHLLSREEAEDLVGKELADQLTYTEVSDSPDDDGTDTGAKNDDSTKGAKLVQVFEIWDKATKTVLFICPSFPAKPLKLVEDPLKLAGFFPCAKPLSFIRKVTTLVPVALYKAYEAQATELNLITTRITKLTAALKVRGMYDSQIQEIANVLQSDDNVLVPADNVAALQAAGMTLDKSIWLAPIEKLVTVLQQLYLNRDQIKRVIYEITGIADIMRGSSQASETLGAQEIKNQWGTLRLKRSQKEVMRYVRENLRIMAEIAVTKFSETTLSAMTGLPWPTGSQKEANATTVQAMALVGQQPTEEQRAIAAAPSWGDILGLLRSDLIRAYRIDIETNSTVDAEATEDKTNITELINAMAQFMNGIAPLIESGTMPFEVAKQMLLTIVRRFRFGPEMEDSLKAMAQPPKQPDPKAAALDAKAKTDQQLAQLKLQSDTMTFEHNKAKLAAETEVGKQKLQAESAVAQAEHQLRMQEIAAQQETMQMTMQMKREEHTQRLELLRTQTAATLATTNASTSAALATAKAKETAANRPPAKKS